MENHAQNKVGIVVYQLGVEAGTMEADFAVSIQETGVVCKGHATGGPVSGFVGDFSILYFDEHGQPDEKPMDLTIRSHGDVFHLSWSENGEQKYRGIGMLCDGKLVAGWRPVS